MASEKKAVEKTTHRNNRKAHNAMGMSMYLGMGSIVIGFLFFGAAFYSFHAQKPKATIITLFCIAIVFMTIIPVTLAVGWASLNR